MSPEAQDRLAELAAMQGALAAVWPTLKAMLEERRRNQIDILVLGESQYTRGRIMELTNLLQLPEQLQQEAQGLVAPQQEGELP